MTVINLRDFIAGTPAALFTSNVLNFALSLLVENETVSGPLSESSSCSTRPVMKQTFRAPAAAMMSKSFASVGSPEVTLKTRCPGAL